MYDMTPETPGVIDPWTLSLRDRIDLAIRWIREQAAFDMMTWGPYVPDDDLETLCGSAACIAGTIRLRLGVPVSPLLHRDEGLEVAFMRTAQMFLRLSEHAARRLFTPSAMDERAIELGYFNADHAVRTLERYRDTGEVHWGPIHV